MQMTNDERPPAVAQADLSLLLQRMQPVETANVSAIRPGLMPRSLTAEEAFIAWALALPEASDARAAAQAALDTGGWPEGASAGLVQFRAYLQEVADMPVALRDHGRRAGRVRKGGAAQ